MLQFQHRLRRGSQQQEPAIFYPALSLPDMWLRKMAILPQIRDSGSIHVLLNCLVPYFLQNY